MEGEFAAILPLFRPVHVEEASQEEVMQEDSCELSLSRLEEEIQVNSVEHGCVMSSVVGFASYSHDLSVVVVVCWTAIPSGCSIWEIYVILRSVHFLKKKAFSAKCT